jgi:hypothetical protein
MAHPPIHIDFLNALDVEALALDRRGDHRCCRGGACRSGPRADRDRAARASDAESRGQRPFQRAARRLPRADQPRRRQGDRGFRRQLQARPALRDGPAAVDGPADWRADRDRRRQPPDRHAHRRDHRDRREISRAQGFQGARPYRRARHRLLECPPARFAVRFRRDPRPFAPARKPRRLRRKRSRPISASA